MCVLKSRKAVLPQIFRIPLTMAINEKETIDEDDEEAVEGEEGAKKRKIPGKKLVLFAGAPIGGLVVILAVLFFLGVFSSPDEEHVELDEHGNPIVSEHDVVDGEHRGTGPIDASQVTFVELPEMLVNLNTSDGRIVYLKLQVAIEIPHDVLAEELDPIMPRVVDQFQLYLRELRLEDLQGSAGMFRLKEELLRRVNAAAAPIEVYDVLFREMIIQ